MLPLAHRSHLGGGVVGRRGRAAMAMGRRMKLLARMTMMRTVARMTITSEESRPPESSTP